MRKILSIFIFLFITESKVNSFEDSELQLSTNVVNHFVHYLRLKGTKQPMAMYVTIDGINATHWLCTHGHCQTHNVPNAVKKCELQFNKKCNLFARKRTVVWYNGINPGKGKHSLFSSKMTEEKVRSKLGALGFLGNTIAKKQPKIKKKTPDNSNLYSDEDIKQLKQLKVLFDEGILTSEEFKKAKKRILN